MGKYDYENKHIANGNNECLINQIENNKSLINEYREKLLNYQKKEKNLINSIIALQNELSILKKMNKQLLEENEKLKKIK